MRGALSLFLLCIALSQAIEYVTPVTIVPTTGFFSPLYKADPPAVFKYTLNGLFGISFDAAFCDGKPAYYSAATCSTYQVVLGTWFDEPVTFFSPASLVVVQTDIVHITLGQNYTSENPTSYQFSSDVPYLYTFTQEGFGFDRVDFSDKFYAPANATLLTTGLAYPLYATTYPTTFEVQEAGSTFVYQGVTYPTNDVICTSQDAVVLVDQAPFTIFDFLPARTCKNFAYYNSAYTATVISTQTPATLSVSASGMYDVTCQTYGNSTSNYVLVKLVNTDATSKGGIINGNTISSRPGTFDAVFNCGADTSFPLNIKVNGPYNEVVSFTSEGHLFGYPQDFYKVNVQAGIISDPSADNPLKDYGGQTCSTGTPFNYFGTIPIAEFSLCYTVNGSTVIDVPDRNSAFIIQPPEGYCIRSDGIPSNSSNYVSLLSDTSSSFFYEDENTPLYTITCSTDTLYVHLNDAQPMTVNFTLVPIAGQGVYGQTYDIDGLLILQYPPLTAPAGVLSIHFAESANSPVPVRNTRMQGGKRAVSDGFMFFSNTLKTNTSPPSEFILLARGQGQMTVNLATINGLNVDYNNISSSSSSTESSSSTSSDESTSSTSSDESTSSTSSDESTSSTSSDESTSSTSSDESTSSTSSDESTSSTSSVESTSSTSSEESTSSTSSVESTSSTSSEESTSSTSSEESSSSTSSEESTSSTTLDTTSSTTLDTTSSTTLDTTSEEPSTESPSTSSVSSTTSTSLDTTSEELSTESPSSTSTTSVQSTTSSTSSTSSSSTSSTSSSSTSSVVTSSESEEGATDSSTTTTTSASVSFTDTSVLPDNVTSDSSMVKASVLSVVVMVLFYLC
ncbi:hypothetical protein PROFUN_03123 [Planoprotostelium fungivorum]|uniref:Uncharacterized protein n=1 Tax=Planoprotostelium fungivorum TaxID=1890364 RepID=A0A2P6NQA1_9EUKA|nr:hypothetical protein PROFUN_03123 [Planoprotostelium fungivorum]